MTTADRKEREYKVQAVERALDILECFSLQDRELNLSEVATKTGLNKTTAKRLISNLTERGYLKKLDSKHYQLGLRLFELGGIVHSSLNLREATSAPMSQIQKETGATVLLGTVMEDQLAMILMAYLEPGEVRRILQKDKLQAYTPLSTTDEDAFSLKLEHIRNQGYVIEKGEAIEGIVGIAAPIRDSSRQVIATLGIVLTNDLARNGMNGHVDLVKYS